MATNEVISKESNIEIKDNGIVKLSNIRNIVSKYGHECLVINFNNDDYLIFDKKITLSELIVKLEKYRK